MEAVDGAGFLFEILDHFRGEAFFAEDEVGVDFDGAVVRGAPLGQLAGVVAEHGEFAAAVLIVDGIQVTERPAAEVAEVGIFRAGEVGAVGRADVLRPGLAADGLVAGDQAEDVPEGGAILGVDEIVAGDGDRAVDEIASVGEVEELDEAGAMHLLAVPAEEAGGGLSGFALVEGETDAAFVRAHLARVARAGALSRWRGWRG